MIKKSKEKGKEEYINVTISTWNVRRIEGKRRKMNGRIPGVTETKKK